jgi:hypothetical protein
MPEMSRTFEPSPVNCGVACMRMVRCFCAKFVHLLAYGSNSTCAICCDFLVQQLKPKASLRGVVRDSQNSLYSSVERLHGSRLLWL